MLVAFHSESLSCQCWYKFGPPCSVVLTNRKLRENWMKILIWSRWTQNRTPRNVDYPWCLWSWYLRPDPLQRSRTENLDPSQPSSPSSSLSSVIVVIVVGTRILSSKTSPCSFGSEKWPRTAISYHRSIVSTRKPVSMTSERCIGVNSPRISISFCTLISIVIGARSAHDCFQTAVHHLTILAMTQVWWLCLIILTIIGHMIILMGARNHSQIRQNPRDG